MKKTCLDLELKNKPVRQPVFYRQVAENRFTSFSHLEPFWQSFAHQMQEVNSVVLVDVQSQAFVASPAANRKRCSLCRTVIQNKRPVFRVLPDLSFDSFGVQIKVRIFFSENIASQTVTLTLAGKVTN